MRRTWIAVVTVLGLVAAGCAADDPVLTPPEDDDPADAAPASDQPDPGDDALPAPVAAMECTPGNEPAGDPIVVGGSLSLTGPLGPTGTIHEAVGHLVTDWVNDCGGLLGRPLEWRVLDDQSEPGQAAANYERLIDREGVDLVIGPYGAATILASAGPVGRAGYIYPTHTNGAPDQEIGDFHFPSWQIGGGQDPAAMWEPAANAMWDALEAEGAMPATVFYAAAKFPTTLTLASLSRDAAEERGAETVDYVEFDLGQADFSPIALRIASAAPDFVYFAGGGADALNLYDAFAQIGYEPSGLFAGLPAPAALAAIGDAADGVYLLSLYEHHAPFTNSPIAGEFGERFQAEAEARNLFPVLETQGAASFGAWQILLTAVVATDGLDHDAMRDWLNANDVETIAGTLSFDGHNGYGSELNRVAQVQDGSRYVVWPAEDAGVPIRQ